MFLQRQTISIIKWLANHYPRSDGITLYVYWYN